jgi:hypothetical protein
MAQSVNSVTFNFHPKKPCMAFQENHFSRYLSSILIPKNGRKVKKPFIVEGSGLDHGDIILSTHFKF